MASSILNLSTLASPGALLLNRQFKQNPQLAQAAPTSTTSSNSGLTGTSTGQTFLNLLVKELQNQDPTAPMDSTAMVGQMISLNQLDQLISINQALSNTTASGAATNVASTSTGAISGSTGMSSVDQIAQRAALMNSNRNATSFQTLQQAVADPSQTLDLSTVNIPHGGK